MSCIKSSRVYKAVTPSDTVDIMGGMLTDRLYIGVAGDVVAVKDGGETVTFKAVPAGTQLYIKCKRVNSTSTTATDIVALF
jgi:hypothetical protein